VKSKGGETFLHADKAHVTESGALLFTGKQRVTVAFSSGNLGLLLRRKCPRRLPGVGRAWSRLSG